MKSQHFVHTDEPSPENIDPIENWEPTGMCSDGGLYNKSTGGMWTSPVDAEWTWLDWVKQNDWYDVDWRRQNGKPIPKVWRLDPTDDAHVYTIDCHDDLCRLHDEYGAPYEASTLRDSYIRFDDVFEDYDGIHLTTTGQSDTRFGEPNLYGWDVAAVLWDDFHFDSFECFGSVDDFM